MIISQTVALKKKLIAERSAQTYQETNLEVTYLVFRPLKW